MYTEIKRCRICGNTDLISIINLGNQYLTGVFPASKTESITSGPLELVRCQGNNCCGLVQLRHSYDHLEMYGDNYGYRSGINGSMVKHLNEKVAKIQDLVDLKKGDLVIDIGSNDSTLLRSYSKKDLNYVGIDPAGGKFKKYYQGHIKLIPDFFSSEIVTKNVGKKKAKVITSIAMFYDLEDPIDFAGQVYEVLADDGIWVFEQSYLPAMLKMNAYDTICHEHLEYYCLKQIKWITDKVGLKIIDVEFNLINGGSFSVIAAKSCAPYIQNTGLIGKILQKERNSGLDTLLPYEKFKERVYKHRNELNDFIRKVNKDGGRVLGYGASTKGNVILQFCDFTEKDIPFIAEVNSDKFGCYTPKTNIPIISEEEAKSMKPDYFMVLPWHFRDNIIERENAHLKAGGKLLFPLPFIEVV